MSTPLDRAVIPGAGALRPFHFPDVQRHVLPNGLQVLVAENHAFPLATVDLVLPSGGLAEPEDRAGVASLTSGLLESGAGERSAAEVAEAVDALGLALESGISWDSTLAGFTALRSRLEPAMTILADLVRRPAFPLREVERIRDERLAGLLARRADPGGLAEELVAHFTFAEGHPFARRLGGPAEVLSSLGRGDVEGFHASRYVPVGGTLAAAGDVTLAEVVALAEAHFGDWEGAPPPSGAPVPENRVAQTTLFLADRPGSVQSEVRLGHLGIERTADDFFAVTVMNAILGGTFSSRLNLNLREKLGYTYGVNSGFSTRKLPGTFAVSSALQSEGTAHSISEILRQIREMQDDLVTAAELDDARNYLAGIFPLGLQTTDGLAGRLSTIAVYGFPLDYFDHYRDGLLAVTADDVREAARRRLMPDRAAIVVVGDAAALRGPLEELGVGPVEMVDTAAVLK